MAVKENLLIVSAIFLVTAGQNTQTEATAHFASATPRTLFIETTSSLPQETTPSLPQDTTPSLPQETTPSIPQETTSSLPKDTTLSIPREITQSLPKETTPSLPDTTLTLQSKENTMLISKEQNTSRSKATSMPEIANIMQTVQGTLVITLYVITDIIIITYFLYLIFVYYPKQDIEDDK